MSKILVPKNLKIEELIERNPLKFKYHVDNFYYIVGTIAQVKDRRDDELGPLYSKILQSKVHNYKDYLSYLEEHGVIEIDHSYVVGGKCKGYRLTGEYSSDAVRVYELEKWSLLKKDKDKKSIEYLDKWFDGLVIDYDKAKHILQEVYKECLGKNSYKYHSQYRNVERFKYRIFSMSVDSNVNRYHSPLTSLKTDLRNALTYLGQRLCCIDIKNSQPYISLLLLRPCFYDKSSSYNIYKALDRERFNLIKPNVPYLICLANSSLSGSMSGNRFGGCTHTGSQYTTSSYESSTSSCLGSLCYSGSYSSTSSGSLGYYEESICWSGWEERKEKEDTKAPFGRLYMLVKSFERQAGTDFELYCHLVLEGKLYEYISYYLYKETGNFLDTTIPKQKKRLKSGVFYTMYSNDEKRKDNSSKETIKDIFKKLFPTVFGAFHKLKDTDDKIHGYKILSVLLQRIESDIMLRYVARELAFKHPELPIFTIHDSIVTLDTDEAKAIVSEAISRHFGNIIGKHPKLSIESWR